MQISRSLLSSRVLSLACATTLTFACAATAAPADGIRAFARLVGGEWRLTRDGSWNLFERWEWGPGERSLVQQTYGTGAEGEGWRSLLVLYQRPDSDEVGLFGLTPDIPGLGTGVSRGGITIVGDTANGTYKLHQPGHPLLDFRDMGVRWDFRDEDTYHDTMFEDSDGTGLRKLAEWTRMRSREESETPPVPLRDAAPSGVLELFAPMVGAWVDDEDERSRTLVEWIPYVGAVRVRGVAQEAEFEAFVYRVPGSDELRCLAFTGDGGVYEGVVVVTEDGDARAEIVDEGEDEMRFAIEVAIQDGGELRQRVWRTQGNERELVIDIAQHRAQPLPD